LFDTNLGTWWEHWHDRLPAHEHRLASLDDNQIGHLADTYGDLLFQPVALARRPGTQRILGPTATAKTLYVLRSQAITAYDHRIAQRLRAGSSAAAFRRHLLRLVAQRRPYWPRPEAKLRPQAAARPGSSVAKLLDEYWYVTVTRG
jgi:hypothetical protein